MSTYNIQMNYLNSTGTYDILHPEVDLSTNITGQLDISNTTGNISAERVSYNNSTTSAIIGSNQVQGAIDDLFTSVSNGKNLIASAITDMGVTTSGTDSWQVMAENIKEINSIKSLGVTLTILPARTEIRNEYTYTIFEIPFSVFPTKQNYKYTVIVPNGNYMGGRVLSSKTLYVGRYTVVSTFEDVLQPGIRPTTTSTGWEINTSHFSIGNYRSVILLSYLA